MSTVRISYRLSRTHRAACVALLILPMLSWRALAADGDEAGPSGKASVRAIYLDLRESYARVPAGSLSFGFGQSSLFSVLRAIADPKLPAFPAIQARNLDVPLTIDVNERVSLYGGVSATSTNPGGSGWSDFALTSWNIGVQADLYEQGEGVLPTVTLQSTLTQSVPNGPLATTTFNNIIEFDYALDSDAMTGLLAGVQHTRTTIGTALAVVRPSTIGYFGGYHQWPNNWKVSGRLGLQFFEGARLLNISPVSSFTQPYLRLDLDRVDDNDNRLFGVTAEIMWVPKPAYQVTLRTPLYALRR